MREYQEITDDKGVPRTYFASDNNATYTCTSAYAHDKIKEFMDKNDRYPSSRWLNKYFTFKRVK